VCGVPDASRAMQGILPALTLDVRIAGRYRRWAKSGAWERVFAAFTRNPRERGLDDAHAARLTIAAVGPGAECCTMCPTPAMTSS